MRVTADFGQGKAKEKEVEGGKRRPASESNMIEENEASERKGNIVGRKHNESKSRFRAIS